MLAQQELMWIMESYIKTIEVATQYPVTAPTAAVTMSLYACMSDIVL